MHNIWYRLIIFSLLLMLVLAPFAGFAPLLLVILIAGVYWFLSPLAKILILGDIEPDKSDLSFSEAKRDRDSANNHQ